MNPVFKTLLIIFSYLIVSSCHSSKLDVEQIKTELDSIKILDQKYRDQLPVLYREYGFESEEFQQIFQKQNKLDSSNLAYVENLIQRLGKYPGKSLVGYPTGEVAFFVLQHAPDSIQEKYLDIILEAAEQKELDKSSVAMYYDRYLIAQDLPQIYGTQIGNKPVRDIVTGITTDSIFLYPVKDTTNIDSLRRWNGLGPLEEYLNLYGLSRW